jgi:FecR protein
MRPASILDRLTRGTALLLCFLMSPLCPAAYSGTDSSDRDPVGKVTGITSSASQNGITATLAEVIRTNERLATNKSGRLRVQLDDGSILSIGSETQFRILKHEASTGETLLDLTAGRLRSRVVKMRRAGAKFQVITPHGQVIVVGTDFFLDVSPERTQVVVYSGIVLVHALNGGSPLDVAAGQTATIERKRTSRLTLISEDYEQETMAETAVPDELAQTNSVTPGEQTRSHLRRNVLIGAVIAAGAITGAVVARRGGGSQVQSQPTQPSIPSIPPH